MISTEEVTADCSAGEISTKPVQKCNFSIDSLLSNKSDGNKNCDKSAFEIRNHGPAFEKGVIVRPESRSPSKTDEDVTSRGEPEEGTSSRHFYQRTFSDGKV